MSPLTASTAARGARPAGHDAELVLVEDDDALRGALVTMLRVAGFRVASYATAEAALGEAHWELADCLVADVRLPGMSGWELIESLRHAGRRTPVVVISADTGRQAREAAERLGVATFLEKPVAGRALVAAIRHAMAA